MNYIEQTSLDADFAAQLASTEFEYDVKFPGGVFSATPAAHAFYDLQPRVATGMHAYQPNRDPKTPSVHVVLAAPQELPPHTPDQRDEIAHYARAVGGLTVWIAHVQHPDEYRADVLDAVVQEFQQEDPRLRSMSKEAARTAIFTESLNDTIKALAPKNQLADMINGAESTLLIQTAVSRESAYPMTPQRRDMLRAQGSRLSMHRQTTEGEIKYDTELITTRAIQAYAIKRTAQVTDSVFRVFQDESFYPYRETRLFVTRSNRS